jgi:hypothetical protein
MARCACEGGEGSCSGVRWLIPTARANTAYPQKLEHRRPRAGPALGHSVAGRQRQPLALPCGVPNADGGIVVEVQLGELGVVQDAGHEVANSSDTDVVVPL